MRDMNRNCSMSIPTQFFISTYIKSSHGFCIFLWMIQFSHVDCVSFELESHTHHTLKYCWLGYDEEDGDDDGDEEEEDEDDDEEE